MSLQRQEFESTCAFVGYLFGLHTGRLAEDLRRERLLEEQPDVIIQKVIPTAVARQVSSNRWLLYAAGPTVRGTVSTGVRLFSSGVLRTSPANGGPRIQPACIQAGEIVAVKLMGCHAAEIGSVVCVVTVEPRF